MEGILPMAFRRDSKLFKDSFSGTGQNGRYAQNAHNNGDANDDARENLFHTATLLRLSTADREFCQEKNEPTKIYRLFFRKTSGDGQKRRCRKSPPA
jgi:hypothetical protein